MQDLPGVYSVARRVSTPNSFIEFFTKTRRPLKCGIRIKRGWHLGVLDGTCKKKLIKSLNVFDFSAIDRCAPYDHLRDHRWLRISMFMIGVPQ